MNEQDVRWKQRFRNFQKSLLYLQEALQIENPDVIQRAGMIQFFEMTFELAWNTLKDYLQAQGFNEIKSPRSAIKKGFEIDLITDGEGWLKLLEDRNLTAHAYDEVMAKEIEKLIRKKYFPLIKELFDILHQK
jgi:nucleotidyltransferase substrate binding protein (TIGR01987 family)